MTDPQHSYFGNLFSASIIENAAKQTLLKWFPTYLAEVARQMSIPRTDLPAPQERNYLTRNELEAEPGEDIPKIVILSPGLANQPQKSGRTYRATWVLGVGLGTAAPTEERARLFCEAYGAAIRAIIIHPKGDGLLGGLVPGLMGIVWTQERYVDPPLSNAIKQYKFVNQLFEVEVDDVMKRFGGPLEPSIADPGAFPTADTVTVSLTKVGLSDEL